MMLRQVILLPFLLLVSGFNPGHRPTRAAPSQSCRRDFLVGSAFTSALLLNVVPANAIPMVTTEEFRIIVRDSARAIKVVEFAGPKSELVTVKLNDGSAFGINDVVESPVDPRSPLKIVALCRESLIATKFTAIEAALAGAPKKTKLFTNERVQKAGEKEKEKRDRMEQDEADRLAKQYEYEQSEAANSKKK